MCNRETKRAQESNKPMLRSRGWTCTGEADVRVKDLPVPGWLPPLFPTVSWHRRKEKAEKPERGMGSCQHATGQGRK